MRRVRQEINRNEERFRQLSDKVEKNTMTDAEMAAELPGLQAGREREEGAMLRKTGDCCLEALWQQIAAVCAAVGLNQVVAVVQGFRESGATQEQTPGRDERRRNSEDEQEQGRTNQQFVLPAQGGINEGTPASSLELDLPRVRGALGECGGAGKKVHQGIAKEVYPTLQLDLRWKKMHCYENHES